MLEAKMLNWSTLVRIRNIHIKRNATDVVHTIASITEKKTAELKIELHADECGASVPEKASEREQTSYENKVAMREKTKNQ